MAKSFVCCCFREFAHNTCNSFHWSTWRYLVFRYI